MPHRHGEEPPGLDAEITEHLQRLEQFFGRSLGQKDDPLLRAVRSGAKFAMPGMMEPISTSMGITTAPPKKQSFFQWLSTGGPAWKIVPPAPGIPVRAQRSKSERKRSTAWIPPSPNWATVLATRPRGR